MARNHIISLIVGVTYQGVIGRNGRAPWRLPSFNQRRRELTAGHPVIMGRKAWESLPDSEPPPGSTNIVLTRNLSYRAEGVLVVNSLVKAMGAASRASGFEEIFILGGEAIFRQFLQQQLVGRAYITKIHAPVPGDTHFPDLGSKWHIVKAEEPRHWDPNDEHPTSTQVREKTREPVR